MSNTRAVSDEKHWRELATQAQAGDAHAYNQLLKELVPFIRAVLRPGIADADAVDDILQEVLISLHKSLKTYSPERPFRPWLGAIIGFRRTDYLRSRYGGVQSRLSSIDDAEFEQALVTAPDHAGELKDIEQALDALPKPQRRVLELMRIRGYSAQEAANETGMSVSAVKVSVHRAMNKLKSILK